MISAVAVAYYAGYALLILTVAVSAFAVWRRRELHRINVLFVVGSLILVPLLGGRSTFLWIARLTLLLAQPYFLIRLVTHFREVPRSLYTTAVAAIPFGTLALMASPMPLVPPASIAGFYCAAVEFYAAAAFGIEAGRTAGVTARRLVFAAFGTWFLAARNVLIGLSSFATPVDAAFWITELLIAGTGVCCYLAFATPRFLRARWQREEQARYLSATADLAPEDRGRLAAADLNQAAARSVGHSLILVGLRADPVSPALTVRASTPPAFVGWQLTPAAGLMGRAVDSGIEQAGGPDACEPDLAARIRSLGAAVLVAPITSTTHTWGAAVVVQRRGSLFPEDDLRLLGQLARYAATALDHARLVTEARERERRAAERRVREIESLMSLMLDSIKDYAMFVLDQRGRVAAWQVGAEHVFGYSSEEMLDEPAAELFDMTPEEFTALIDEAERLGHAEREGTCRRRDGAKFIGAMTLRPLEAQAGDPAGLVAVTRDVTEQRNLEARLQQGQKLEAIGQLAGGIAHDFNNQLTAIMGYADALEAGLSGDRERKEEIGQIQRATERAAALTRQLLAFSRRQFTRPTAVNLSRLVTDLLPMLRRVIGEQIAIVDECASDLSAVFGDRSQLEQIVVNLAVNARDAMPRGGRLAIRTAMVAVDQTLAAGELAPGRHVLLEVTDTGTGMDPSTMSRIFEPFFTTKEFGGTGLGLATVYGIVKQMAGAIRVDSELGRGTTFRLYFPETHERESARPEPLTGEIPGGHETVLVLEDDEGVRAFLRDTLERHGYRVLVAEQPAVARAIAETYTDRIDLVILDVVLPGTTGTEFARELAGIRPGLPTLYISGYADAVLARQGTRPKASNFLQKPFSAADLLRRIRHLLATR